MRVTRMAAMAAAAVFVVGCGEQRSVTDVRASEGSPSLAVLNGGGSAASFTTVNSTADCGNGPGNVNCNLYLSKDAVYLNGGPASAALGDGFYYWAIITPSSQSGGYVDEASGNLSDAFDGPTTGDNGTGDVWTNRRFSVVNGVFTYAGTHPDGVSPTLRKLAPFDDTDNNGNQYILAICTLPSEDAVPSADDKCKFDAFKVKGDGSGGVDGELAPTISKDAAGSFVRTYSWKIEKTVDKTLVSTATNATFNYTVTVTRTGSTDTKFAVTGTITVNNPNTADIEEATVVDNMTGATCVVTGGTKATLKKGDTTFPYTCTFAAAPSDLSAVTNSASVSWPDQNLGTEADPKILTGDVATIPVPVPVTFTMSEVDESVTVTDAFNGGVADQNWTVTAASPSTVTVFTYPRTIAASTDRCIAYPNVATFTTNDTKTTGSAQQSVTVCVLATAGLTIGFWQNRNGQGLISNGSATGNVCNVATNLRTFLPLQDLSATASCAATATYVFNTIKAANASGASMNAMLKAQFLATALSVHYSSQVDKSKIPGPSLGPILMDLTQVCKLTSTGTCSGSFQNVTAAFGNPATGYLSIQAMLQYAATQSTVGGGQWYSQVKPTQELAKNAFDAINNKSVVVATP